MNSGGPGCSPIVEARDLRKTYRLGPAEIQVLRGLNVAVERGEIVGVVGASGVGKSTLLHLLGALDQPTSGEVLIDGQHVSGLDERALADLRSRKVGFVFQFHHLLPEFSAVENVAMPRLIAGGSRGEAFEAARELLAEVGLSDRVDHRPSELSGGEQQRVAVARALVNAPAIVLADEPSGNLDRATGAKLHDLIWGLRDRRGQTFVIASHDPALVARVDRVIRLADGVVADEAPDAAAVETAKRGSER
jgi:lipoprotein-releasing system ATP-binding protein